MMEQQIGGICTEKRVSRGLSEKGSDQEGAPNEQKTFRLARDREKILDRIGN